MPKYASTGRGFPIPTNSCSGLCLRARTDIFSRFGSEIGMNAEDDTSEGLDGFSRIPLDYFVDLKGREHIFRFAGTRDLEKVQAMYRRFEPKRGNLGVPPENPIRLEAWVTHFFSEGIATFEWSRRL